ncbi:MAG: hypothetical protein IJK62_06550 [Bacteroidales bacterium]|nr:hypothetical protein [Bacteroidales bacterium]MBQ1653220.1 hypothetical protein [Bacteroidales bacterium]MBQ1731887.1 hypothetical protein [Bacteroidales bacterium]MBQ2575318.1 hypothetical protein [Bacteroidales bacterium]MBQ6276346.1 hypothetical protein [Bacteroidales bacterium]
MKKIILLFVLVISVITAFSQVSQIDSRLYAKYSEEELLDMQQNRPYDLEYLNWFVENSYVIKDVANPEALNYPKLKYMDKETKMESSEVTEFDAENFNIMEYGFEILARSSNVYLIGNTGKILVFYSSSDLTKLYNEYKRRHYENN